MLFPIFFSYVAFSIAWYFETLRGMLEACKTLKLYEQDSNDPSPYLRQIGGDL